jgi:transposase InsO family protein
VFREEGLPLKVISDRGWQLVSGFMQELYKLLGVEGNPSTAYHPQTNRQTKRINREVEKYLCMFVNHRQNNWADWLPLAQFAYNNAVHEATGFMPFFLNKGCNPRVLPTNPVEESGTPTTKHLEDCKGLPGPQKKV